MNRVSRRRLLSVLGAGFGAFAECGYRPGRGDVRWTIQTGTGQYRPDEVLAAGETLFLVSRSKRSPDDDYTSERAGHIAAYRATTGTELWEKTLAPIPLGRSATHGETLYVGTETGEVVAISSDGTERWRARTSSVPRFVAATVDRVYAMTSTGTIHAVDARDGGEEWQQRVDPTEYEEWLQPVYPTKGAAIAATSTETVVAHVAEADMSTVTAIDETGIQRWSIERSVPNGHEIGPPVITEESVYVSVGRTLLALAVEDGTERWSHQGGHPIGAPALTTDSAYYTGGDTLYAVNTRNGQEQWTFGSTSESGVTSPPAVAGNDVYIGGGGGFTALAATDGTVRWQADSQYVTDTLVVDQTAIETTYGTIRGHWRESS